MALQSSGAISLQDIEDEFGGTGSISLSEYYRNGTYVTSNNTSVPTSGTIDMADFYGTVKQFTYTFSSNAKEVNLNTTLTNAGWDGSAPVVLTINSGVYLWSDNTSVAGLTISSAFNNGLTITNNGYIIGRGGNGGAAENEDGGNGGPAISNSATNVVIINSSGAYIAGGGGGGGASGDSGYVGGGGGGAGGGIGGGGGINLQGSAFSSAALGAQGGPTSAITHTYGDAGSYVSAVGGYAGGGGSQFDATGSDKASFRGGNGGRSFTAHSGNIGGAGGNSNADGGSQGNAGSSSTSGAGGGGGGGWGAAGGNGGYSNPGNGGSGGAAISGTSVSLTNNGTIYGST